MPTTNFNYDFKLFNSSKVVTKDNAAVMLETVGLMRTMASLYETSGIPTCKHIREQANRLEAIAKMMLEEC